MNLDVFFDDDMVDVYRGNVATTKEKLRKIMAYVQEIYEEKDTLQGVTPSCKDPILFYQFIEEVNVTPTPLSVPVTLLINITIYCKGIANCY